MPPPGFLLAESGSLSSASLARRICGTRSISRSGYGIIRAERMKMEEEHRVPLADASMAILEKLRQSRGGDFIFPRRAGKPLSNMAMLVLLRRMKGGDLTVHGFRLSCRDWAAACTGFPFEVAEMALAHSVGDKVEVAYWETGEAGLIPIRAISDRLWRCAGPRYYRYRYPDRARPERPACRPASFGVPPFEPRLPWCRFSQTARFVHSLATEQDPDSVPSGWQAARWRR